MSCKHTTVLTTGSRDASVQSLGVNGRTGCDLGGARTRASSAQFWARSIRPRKEGGENDREREAARGTGRDGRGPRVEFPFAIPPGLVILLAGALFVGLAPWRWATGVGAFLGLFVTCGFLISGGVPNFLGADGSTLFGTPNPVGRDTLGTVVGTWSQMLGVLTALIAGVVATRNNYRKPATRVRQ